MNPPQAMREADRWVVWKYVHRGGKPTKIPYQVNGRPAKSNDETTWSRYDEAEAAVSQGDYSGLGFMLGDGWAGVDFDNVIEDGEVPKWVDDWIEQLGSYAEVSPSGNGIKVFCQGSFDGSGKNHQNQDGTSYEVYCRGRYFAFTGDHWGGSPKEVGEADSTLELIRSGHDPTLELIDINDPAVLMKHRLDQMPESIEGEGGHDKIYHAACAIRREGFDGDEGLELLRYYNEHRAVPPWDDYDVRRKWSEACKAEPLGVASTPREAFSLDLMTHQEFRAQKFDQNFLVDGAVVAGEHLVLGGPKKALKTSILVDLAMSVATGTPFLGRFAVPEPAPAIIVSGESGGATLVRTADRVADAKGLERDSVDDLYWGLRLPNLTLPEHLLALKEDILRTGAKLAAIDPAYLALLGGDPDKASNVFAMGQVLAGFGQVGVDTGCTLALAHHTRGGGQGIKMGRMPTLGDLSMAGFAEWARQWILVNHNKAREGGRIELKMNLGGSAGHGGEYLVRVDEGFVSDGLDGRKWDVDIDNLGDEPEPAAKEKLSVIDENVGKIVEYLTRTFRTDFSWSSMCKDANVNWKTFESKGVKEALLEREDFAEVDGKGVFFHPAIEELDPPTGGV